MGNRRIYLGSATSKYAKIAGGAIVTITSLFFVLMAMGFEITGTDDICAGTPEDPCVSYGKICNLGPNNYDIYNPDEIKLDFSPTIKSYWMFFKDGRVKKNYFSGKNINFDSAGWRYENFTDATKPLSNRVYVHRFARYDCQNYMIVGLKENSNDVVKWGVGVGKEYLDPFWYGPENTSGSNVNVEFGNPINITAGVTGAATTCVNVDHPEYGDNYTCGTPNATFTFNTTYFRRTNFNDSSILKEITGLPKFLNYTCWTTACTGAIITVTKFESCINVSVNKTGTISTDVKLRPEWTLADSPPIIRIRYPNTTLMEEHTITLDSSYSDGIYTVYSEGVVEAGAAYGYCLRHEQASQSVGFYRAEHLTGAPDYDDWPGYGIDMTTGEVIANPFGANLGQSVSVYSTSEDVYVKAHSYDEVLNFTLNLTSSSLIEKLKVFIGLTNVVPIGIIASSGSNIDYFSDDLTTKNISFYDGGLETIYFKVPKDADIIDAKMNLSGFYNTTYYTETSSATDGTNYVTNGSCQLSASSSWRDGSKTIYTKLYDNSLDPCAWYFYGNYSNPTLKKVYSNFKFSTGNVNNGWTINDSTYDLPAGCYGNANVRMRIDGYLDDFLSSNLTLACYNHTSSTWYDLVNNYKTSTQFLETKIYENNMGIFRYPNNTYLEVGAADGVYEWEFDGEEFNSTFSPNRTANFSDEIISAQLTCSEDDDGLCVIPIYLYADRGIITVDALNISILNNPNPITITTSFIEDYLAAQDGDVNLPITVSMKSGSINVSDIKYDYYGGNSTIAVLAFESGNESNNETFNIISYVSSFIKALPYTWTTNLFFLPATNSSKNVSAFKQSGSTPIYNITTTNYGNKAMNISIKVNESYSCMNLTWSTTNETNPSNIVNTTWQEIMTSKAYGSNEGIWVWASLEDCNDSTRILNPTLQLESYCVDCEWN